MIMSGKDFLFCFMANKKVKALRIVKSTPTSFNFSKQLWKRNLSMAILSPVGQKVCQNQRPNLLLSLTT